MSCVRFLCKFLLAIIVCLILSLDDVSCQPVIELTGNRVTASWDANSEQDLAGYRVARIARDDTLWHSVSFPDTAFVLFNHVKSLVYEIRVQAVDTAGNWSDFSNSVYYVVVADEDSSMRDPCDLNRDGRLDGRDLSIFKTSLWSRKGDSMYFEPADVNGDGRIDGRDLSYCKLKWWR